LLALTYELKELSELNELSELKESSELIESSELTELALLPAATISLMFSPFNSVMNFSKVIIMLKFRFVGYSVL
jgi:hypothetical protein